MKRLLLGGGASQAISVLIMTFAARSLGPTQFGLAASILAIGFTAGTVSNFGLNVHHTRILSSEFSALSGLIGAFAGRVISAFLIGSAAGTFASVVGSFSIWSALSTAAVAGASQFTQCMQVPLYAKGSYWIVATANLVDKAAFAAAFSVVVHQGRNSAISLVLCCALGNVVSGSFAAVTWGRSVQWRNVAVRFPDLRRQYRESGWAGVAGLSFSAQQLDVVAARAVSPGQDAGEYGAVSRWTQPLVMISAATAATVLRDASAASSHEEAFRAAINRARRPFFAVVALALGLAVTTFMFAGLVLGPEYQNSGAPASLLVASTPFSFANQISLNFLLARHQDRRGARWAVVTVAVQLILVAPLTVALGSAGPALAMLGMQVSLCALLARECLVTRRLGPPSPSTRSDDSIHQGDK